MARDDGPLGAFEEQVMLAVLRTGEQAFGMAVRREIATATGRDVTVGAVYATLDRLEAKRFVTSRRATIEGESRRLFAVTRTGAQALADTRDMREELWRGVTLNALLRPR